MFAAMVSEQAIEQSLEALTAAEAVEQGMLTFASEQVPYLQYLRTDSFDLLTDDERDYLLYLGLVIYRAARSEAPQGAPRAIPGERIEEWDERCWEWMQATVGKPMTERLTVFFDNIDQEELLAFAEDSLTPVEEDAPAGDAEELKLFDTGASRELAFVALAVLVAGLDAVIGS